MRTMGIKPGEIVTLIERRGKELVNRSALVVNLSMDEQLAGANGEMAIEVQFVAPERSADNRLVKAVDVVHISHRDWTEGRAGLGYAELPHWLKSLKLEEGQRQAMLLALAKLAIERPGWLWTLESIALTMDNLTGENEEKAELFREFYNLHKVNPPYTALGQGVTQ